MKGLGTALITPFKADKSIDYVALERLLELQIAGGVDYIVVLGTTAETATLSSQEKQELRDFIVKQVNARVPLVLGMGGNNTQSLLQEIQQTNLKPFEAILSVCPYYNKPSQEGLYQHFVAVAEASPIPVILYNVPGRTGVNLLPETVLRIYHTCPNKIIGVKEASGNVEQIKQLITLSENRLHVISGDDALTHQLMQAGASGLISVASNAFPAAFAQLVHNREQGAYIQEHFAELIHLLFVEGNPAGIKTVLSQQGICENSLRLPLVPNSVVVQQNIAQTLQAINI